MELDVSDPAALDAAVKAHDLVISLVPAPFHVGIAEACISNNTNMLTTSYVSPEMQALDERAVEVSEGARHSNYPSLLEGAEKGGGREGGRGRDTESVCA